MAVSAALAVAQPLAPNEKDFTILNWTDCGLITRYASNKIPPSCLAEAFNLILDEDFTILRRSGQGKYNATACMDAQSIRGLWPFYATDGTKYLVIQSSASFFKTSGSGDCALIAGLTGFSATADWECTQAMGKLVCTNGANTPFSWNGTSTNTLTNMPLGRLIGHFRNRIVTGDVPGALTRIRLSGELDETDWALQVPGRSTTPASIDIAGTHDGKRVKGFLGEYQDTFWLGREDELYALYGSDRRDFTLRKMSSEIGITEPRSVKEKNNALYWMSRRGIEKLSGTTISRVSDPIRPDIDEIITAAANSRSHVETTQADWEAGQLCVSGSGACLSSTLSPTNVVPSTWSKTDTSGADFAAGTLTATSTTSIPGSLTMFQDASVHQRSFINAGAETSATLNWETQNWTRSASYPIFDTYSWFSAGNCTAGNPTVQILDVNNNILLTQSWGGIGYKSWGVDTSTLAVSMIKVRFLGSGLSPCDGRSVPFIRPSSVEFSSYGYGVYDFAELYDLTATSLSPTFDTSFSTPTWGAFSVNFSSSPSGRLTFETQTSTSPAGSWTSLVTSTPGVKIPSAAKRYIRYKASFAVDATTNTPAQIDDVTLLAATTGYGITDCVNTTGMTEWGDLRATYLNNDGTVTLWVSTGTSCNGATRSTNTWTAQTPNSPITISTAAYLGMRYLLDGFGTFYETSTPRLQDITVEWSEGSNRPKVASAVHRDRYWLFYTTSTASGAYNDSVLVLDSNDKWTKFTGITACSAGIYQNKLYAGDSQNTGYIYQQDIGQTDDGSAYTFKFKTADLDMGEPYMRKVWKRLYLILESEVEAVQDIDISVSYYIDSSTTSYSLSSVDLGEATEPGFFTAKFPFPNNQPATGKWIAIEVQATEAEGPIRIHGMKLIYTVAGMD